MALKLTILSKAQRLNSCKQKYLQNSGGMFKMDFLLRYVSNLYIW